MDAARLAAARAAIDDLPHLDPLYALQISGQLTASPVHFENIEQIAAVDKDTVLYSAGADCARTVCEVRQRCPDGFFPAVVVADGRHARRVSGTR